MIHDAALPHLATALDAAAMAGLFGRELAPAGHHVLACSVDRIKYRPQRNCSVSYLLTLRDARTGALFEQRIGTRWCSGGDSAKRYAKAAACATMASAAGPALSHLPALDLFASWLPNDAKLTALAELLDDQRLRTRWLPEVIGALSEGRGRLVEHQVALVQWAPEHRVCARVDLQLRRDGSGATEAHTLYVKADAERRGAATHALMQALHPAPLQASGALRTPRPVLWQPAAGLHWQRALDGVPLFDLAPQVAPAHAAQVGKLLAALHATPAPLARAVTPAELRRQPHEVAALLGSIEPGWQAPLERLLRALDRGADALAAAPVVTLHGDLHPGNLLLCPDGRLALIDFDSARHGPAAIELGSWVADTLFRAVLDARAPNAVAASWRTFLQSYRVAAGGLPDESLLAWSTAHQLLCQRAYRCVVNLKPGRLARVPALFELAEAIARAGTLDAACRAVFADAGRSPRRLA